MSRNAITLSVRATMSAGMSPAAIRQKRQSVMTPAYCARARSGVWSLTTTREGFAQTREHPTAKRGQSRFGELLAAQPRELGEQLRLLVVQFGGRLNVQVNIEVSAPCALQAPHAQALEGHGRSRVSAGPDVDLLRPIKAFHRGHRAERGGRHGQLQRAVEVVASALKGLVREFTNLDVEVASRPSAQAGIAGARHADPRPRLDAGRNVDVDRPALSRASLPGAFGAGALDDRPVAAAARARGRGHDLAQQGTRHSLHHARPVALRAGDRLRPWRATRTAAGVAYLRQIHENLAVDTEDGLLE